MKVNVARVLQRSSANGPGDRFVIWVQGCPLACRGCWNPETWTFEKRDLRSIDELCDLILSTAEIEGVTFSGGEPFAQSRALARLASKVRASGLSVLVFSGYDLDELTRPDHLELLSSTDILVAGRYKQTERSSGSLWRGSSNQRVYFLSNRYSCDSVQESGQVEFHLREGQAPLVTGFPVESAWGLGTPAFLE